MSKIATKANLATNSREQNGTYETGEMYTGQCRETTCPCDSYCDPGDFHCYTCEFACHTKWSGGKIDCQNYCTPRATCTTETTAYHSTTVSAAGPDRKITMRYSATMLLASLFLLIGIVVLASLIVRKIYFKKHRSNNQPLDNISETPTVQVEQNSCSTYNIRQALMNWDCSFAEQQPDCCSDRGIQVKRNLQVRCVKSESPMSKPFTEDTLSEMSWIRSCSDQKPLLRDANNSSKIPLALCMGGSDSPKFEDNAPPTFSTGSAGREHYTNPSAGREHYTNPSQNSSRLHQTKLRNTEMTANASPAYSRVDMVRSGTAGCTTNSTVDVNTPVYCTRNSAVDVNTPVDCTRNSTMLSSNVMIGTPQEMMLALSGASKSCSGHNERFPATSDPVFVHNATCHGTSNDLLRHSYQSSVPHRQCTYPVHRQYTYTSAFITEYHSPLGNKNEPTRIQTTESFSDEMTHSAHIGEVLKTMNMHHTPSNMHDTHLNMHDTPMNMHDTPMNMHDTPMNMHDTHMNMHDTPMQHVRDESDSNDDGPTQRIAHSHGTTESYTTPSLSSSQESSPLINYVHNPNQCDSTSKDEMNGEQRKQIILDHIKLRHQTSGSDCDEDDDTEVKTVPDCVDNV